MCPRRSHTLVTLTRITSNERKFKWNKIEQDTFNEINRILAYNTLSAYTHFNEAFKIHTNSSAFQLEAIIIQKSKPIALYSRKLTED